MAKETYKDKIAKEIYKDRIVCGNGVAVEKVPEMAVIGFSRLYESVETLKQNYLQIGKELYEFSAKRYYEAFGYSSLSDFCQSNLHMDKGAVSRCIDVWKMVAKPGADGCAIQDKYSEYSYSQLVELVTLKESEREEFSPHMTVKEIRERKRDLKNEKKGIVQDVASAKVEGSTENISCDVATVSSTVEIMDVPEESDNSLFAYLQTLDLDTFARALRAMNMYCLADSERVSYLKLKGLLKKDASVYFEKVNAGENENRGKKSA